MQDPDRGFLDKAMNNLTETSPAIVSNIIDNYTLGVTLITIFLSLFIIGTLSLVLDSILSYKKTIKSKPVETSTKLNKENFEEDLADIDYSVDYDNLS
jgi:hypothetical protein